MRLCSWLYRIVCRSWALRVILPTQQKMSGSLRQDAIFLTVEFIEAVASAEQNGHCCALKTSIQILILNKALICVCPQLQLTQSVAANRLPGVKDHTCTLRVSMSSQGCLQSTGCVRVGSLAIFQILMSYTLLNSSLSQTLSLPLLKWDYDLANTLQAVNQIPATVTLQSAFFKGKPPKVLLLNHFFCCLLSAFGHFSPFSSFAPCVFHHLCELIGESFHLEQCDLTLDF